MSAVKTRDSASKALSRYLKLSQKEDEDTDLEQIENYVRLLDDQWQRFRTAQDSVDETCGPDNEGLEEEIRTQAETWYVAAHANLNKLIKSSKIPQGLAPPVSAVKSNMSTPLPKMVLPTFSGNTTEWLSFNDSFNSLIDSNDQLTASQKLQYLRSCLKGEALNLITNLSITNENYKEARSLLVQRYNVLRVLVDEHIDAILKVEQASSDTPTALKAVLDAILQHTRSLRALGRPVDFWDDWLVHLTVTKLPHQARKEWELSLTSNQMPVFDEITHFLENRCRSLSALKTYSIPCVKSGYRPVSKSTSSLHVSNAGRKEDKSCYLCREVGHSIYSCCKYDRLLPKERLNLVKSKGACLNCLSSGHHFKRCSSKNRCRECHEPHHTSLHAAYGANATASTAISAPINNAYSTPVSLTSTIKSAATTTVTIVLATALAVVKDASEGNQIVRILFDSGSHATFISESCMQRLGLPRNASTITITGIGGSVGERTRGAASVSLVSRTIGHSYLVNALVLRKITNNLPSVPVKGSWGHISDLPLADPHYGTPGPIDLLIGMDQMGQLLLAEMRKGEPNTPMAQNTVFGWVLFGAVEGSPSPNNTSVPSLHCCKTLDTTLRRFWEIEELPDKKYLTSEEFECETHFNKTHDRAADGRFIVELPMKTGVPLGDSRDNAVSNFLRMEKRLARNPTLRKGYKLFMEELLKMGHMEPVAPRMHNVYYMPHHAVVKESSETTKIRVVFNASKKTTSGWSLNDALMVGPQLQPELFSTLLRFRTRRFAMTADIAKMYRQVYVSKECVDLQRLIWRPSPEDPLQDYRMLRVTYGLASASYLAVRCLQETGKQSKFTNTDVVDTICSDFYMDDLLTGSNSEKELIRLQRAVSATLAEGGFELRKWATNSSQLAESFPQSLVTTAHFLAEDQEVRALGLVWNTTSDSISFVVHLNPAPMFLSKRAFLSDASMLFDPLGLIAPVTVQAKIWFQQIWSSGVDWDEPVPERIARKWLEHRSGLKTLGDLKIPRWLGTEVTYEEVHVFADASQSAYAAVAYMRTFKSDGKIEVVLIAARTRVAPLKTTTLPRLELCAAHLASKLLKQVRMCVSSVPTYEFAWSDSTVTLAWLQSHPSKWSPFVANRVAEIQAVLPAENWGHVRSEYNPADIASRGASPIELMNSQMWWEGPPWLKDPGTVLPKNNTGPHQTQLEMRSKRLTVLMSERSETWNLLTRFSCLTTLKRVTAYIMRFVRRLRSRMRATPPGVIPLTAVELQEAEIVLIKYTQNLYYSKEIYYCSEKKPLPLSSNIIRLQPFLDDQGVLRVGGRIQKADVAVDIKHPVILPKDTPLSKLIVQNTHLLSLHGGPQMMKTLIQRRFWIVGVRNLVRKFYRSCVKCQRLNQVPLRQVMSSLPHSRLVCARSFLRSAVDFAGPYQCKFAPGRGSKAFKGYICSFICMATGAMHLEFVGSLTTSGFLNALKRFINRRGHCEHLYSDNGTNFVGAERELKRMLEACREDETLARFVSDSNVVWHFNPPSAPHMGGYWEAGIKRVKYYIKRSLTDKLLTFEEFSTLLTEIEACVNSRPLCFHTSDVGDLEILTPGHFTVGSPLKVLPDPDVEQFQGTLGQRWQLLTAIRKHFWSRWHDEYLLSLQRRSRWFRPEPNLRTGDIVVIRCENLPPTKWKLGKVLRCHPGEDGRVRVVTLKTEGKELVRPVVKLCLLPNENVLL